MNLDTSRLARKGVQALCRKVPALNLIFSLLLLGSGCAGVLIAGASGGVAYTLTNVAYKTVSYPIETVEKATRTALKEMAIEETAQSKGADSVQITAQTGDLTITIDLEAITSKTTRMSVDARKNIIIKDKATATEIIEHTVRRLSP